MDSCLFDDLKDSDYYVASGPSAPFPWYGGKAYYARWIIGHFPEHRIYVEPFGGAANVLLRKKPSEVEVYNDLDDRLVDFFRVLRDREHYEELVRLATLTPYSRREFERLVQMPVPDDIVQRAWWFFVRCRQALGGLGMSRLRKGAWATSTRTRRHMAEPVSKYLSAIEGLADVADRFCTIMIEALPAVDVIKKYDKEGVLFYVDPPYLPETRCRGNAETYAVEMSYQEHEELLRVLKECNGKVLLSGYDSDLYRDKLSEWNRGTCEGKAHMSNSGQSRTEVLWMNW